MTDGPGVPQYPHNYNNEKFQDYNINSTSNNSNNFIINMTKKQYIEHIEDNTIRMEASRRGGGIEIDASALVGIDGAKMTAYQNYLGGGMLGAVDGDMNFIPETPKQEKVTVKLSEILKEYYHNVTNEKAGWSAKSYKQNQALPVSAY